MVSISPRWRTALTVAAAAIVLNMIGAVVAPFFFDLTRWGFHDWDTSTAARLLTVRSLKDFAQFPFWNPYACGGYPAWSYVEGGTNVVSPFLPFYLALPLPLALRLEVVGSAIVSAIGTWLLAGRFTKSIAARTLVCVLFVVNGRWALQAGSGHLWHCYYAYMPWVLYFFERAHGLGRRPGDPPPRFRDPILAGLFLALMVYAGAIYPLPHTIFVVAVYGTLLAIAYRSLRPITQGIAIAATFVGFAAPKLLPVLDAFSKSPRLTDSPETLDLTGFVTLLTSYDQHFGSRPASVSHWGWHEWGMYIGWIPLLLLIAGLFFHGGQKRDRIVKAVGLVLLVLGFGSFHRYAPWTLLHELPIFSSQHVPSRWLYPALLLLALPLAAWLGRLVERSRRAPLVEIALLAGVLFVSLDIAGVARVPMRQVFQLQLRPVSEQAEFRQYAKVPASLHYVVPDWSLPAVPAMLSNVGVIECYGVAGLAIYWQRPDGTIAGQGARGIGHPNYRGEAYLPSGVGKAKVVSFSPNRIEVQVEGAQPGDVLVLNQNFDPSWRANGEPAFPHKDAVATKLSSGDGIVTFRYWPRRQWAGLGLFAFTLAAIAFAWKRKKAESSRASALSAPADPRRRSAYSPAARRASSSPGE